MGFKITKIDQDNSEYNSVDGVFKFVLDGIPDQKWRNKFSDYINSYNGRHFSKAPVNPVDTNIVEAYAKIHGDHDLEFVSNLLVSIIDSVNNEYDEEIQKIADEEMKKKAARAALDIEVRDQISKIKF